MNLLFKQATILDPTSGYHGKTMDLLVQDGIISKIAASITENNAKVIHSAHLRLSIGWLDIGAQIGDPGFEHREDLQSATAAAAAGGYTAVACYPNSQPVVHSKSGVFYLKQNSGNCLVDFLPIGAISHNCEGKDITEMIDMHQAGAVAFSDGSVPIQDNGLMMRALLYTKTFNGVVLNHPHDKTIALGGHANEGIVSTSLGMKGIPNMAEEIMLQRDLDLVEYTASKLHIANISTARAVEMVREAKRKGMQITASVAAINLVFTDEVLGSFDANYKVLPPLRRQKDRAALLAGLQDGTIDIINSNHVPLEEEAKKLEFTFADFGVIGLQTTFAVANTQVDCSTETLIEKMAYNTRKLLNLEIPKIEAGAKANLTAFDPTIEWKLDHKDIRSKSSNTPFIDFPLKGKVLATINNNQSEILV